MSNTVTSAFGPHGEQSGRTILVAGKVTEKLCKEFDVICQEKEVYQGLGPPMAYFECIEAFGRLHRYVYVAFSMGGEMPPGMLEPCTDSPEKVIVASVRVFRNWIKPNRTLVWRMKPEVGHNNAGKWTSYWRCLQLEDDARRIDLRWNI